VHAPIDAQRVGRCVGGGAPHALPQEKDFKIFVNKNAIKRKNSGIPPPDFLTTPSTPLRTI